MTGCASASPYGKNIEKNVKILKFSKISYFSFEINPNGYSHRFQHQEIMQIDVSDAFRHPKISILRNIFQKMEI